MEQISTTKLGKTLFLFDEGEQAEPDLPPLQTKIINHINKTELDLIDFLIEETALGLILMQNMNK